MIGLIIAGVIGFFVGAIVTALFKGNIHIGAKQQINMDQDDNWFEDEGLKP